MNQYRISSWPGWFARTAAGATATLGGLVLAGWAFDVHVLKSMLPGLPLMVPNTAVGFVLAGASLWLLTGRLGGSARHRTGQAAAFAVVLLGGLTVSESISGWRLNIDHLFFREATLALPGLVP
ncbi:MAG TPA: histidine kinase, partial [Candidatus Limnocylindria bacterium]|nr:histidine kinase [Candidatus Limnocylindria bacterium]